MFNDGLWREFLSTHPLRDAILTYIDSEPVRFHMPGHKGHNVPGNNRALPDEVIARDVTELPGLDDLHSPQGPIAELEARLASAYDCRASFLSVQGSTLGIHAAVMSCCRDGDTILVGRDCHRSVISALVLAGARPFYLEPIWCPSAGITLGPPPAAYARAIATERSIKAVIATSPNYIGASPPIASIARLCHRARIPLIVDEAHGSHLKFTPHAPSDALTSGADIAVQSPHKTLVSVTQTAWVHVSGDLVDPRKVKSNLSLLQTSSPSYLLLTSLEEAVAFVESEKLGTTSRLASVAREADRFRQGIRRLELALPCEEGLPEEWAYDPLRLFVSAPSRLGLNGQALAEALAARRIIVELALEKGVLAMLGAGTRLEQGGVSGDIDAFLTALADIVKSPVSQPGVHECRRDAVQVDLTLAKWWGSGCGYPLLLPREAHMAENETVPLAQAVGRVSAGVVAPFPPAVVLLAPGDLVTPKIIEAIAGIRGDERKLSTILVVK